LVATSFRINFVYGTIYRDKRGSVIFVRFRAPLHPCRNPRLPYLNQKAPIVLTFLGGSSASRGPRLTIQPPHQFGLMYWALAQQLTHRLPTAAIRPAVASRLRHHQRHAQLSGSITD
jgi:hypothetical protein